MAPAESEIFDRFTGIVARSLRIDQSAVKLDSHLMNDLGAESLDLIEITMETEAEFNVWLPEKSILETAGEIYGSTPLQEDGHLTEAGKQLLRARVPAEDARLFEGNVAVTDLQNYFLTVRGWLTMIRHLVQHTPPACESCGGTFNSEPGFRLKCSQCGNQVALRSGEELNRDWVREFHAGEHRASASAV